MRTAPRSKMMVWARESNITLNRKSVKVAGWVSVLGCSQGLAL